VSVKYAITLLTVILILPTTAAKLAVHPEKIEIHAYGGETITKYIVVGHNEPTPIFVTVKTKAYPDSVGLNITYDKERFVIFPDEPTIVQMTIQIAKNIKPRKYVIKTEFNASVPQKIVENKTLIEEINETLTQLDQLVEILQNQSLPLNLTEDQVQQIINMILKLKDKINALSEQQYTNQTQVLISKLIKELEESKKEVNKLRGTLDFALEAMILLMICVVTLLVLLIIIRRR